MSGEDALTTGRPIAIEALINEWTTAACQTDGAPCSWHRIAAECADELRGVLRGGQSLRARTTQEVVAELIADHPMWIGDDGRPLDYSPEREARIAEFCSAVSEALDA